MEQRFYKVRLKSGRVIGPLDLERLKLFILKDQITGLEQARLYPVGDWIDINRFPEIADLFLQKLEGKLTAPQDTLSEVQLASTQTGTPHLEIEEPAPPAKPESSQESVEEQTLIVTPEMEKTVISDTSENDSKIELEETFGELNEYELSISQDVSKEKTKVLSLPNQKKARQRKIFVGIGIVLASILIFLPEEQDKIQSTRFVVELPSQGQGPNAKTDPQKSEEFFKKALVFYNEDTVEGYKRAAKLFLKSATLDPNNAKALALLASSYINIIDIIDRNEHVFNVITKLIELARAKTINIAETVIADVELYLMLNNPEAAINRIVEFTKERQFTLEMFYYLAQSLYFKGKYVDALKYLNNIAPESFFSAKVPFLYGLIFKANKKPDEARKAFEKAVAMSPKHIKARLELAEIYFSKDNIPSASKHIDYIIAHSTLASKHEKAKTHYIKARIYEIATRDEEAVKELRIAKNLYRKNEDSLTGMLTDILMEYYTVKARLGQKIKNAADQVKMFQAMADGEKAFKAGDLDRALKAFLTARDAKYSSPEPLLRLADVYTKKGELQAARRSLEKAVKLRSGDISIFKKYVKTLIDAYELIEAQAQLKVFIGLGPPVQDIDILNGDLHLKEGRLRAAHAYYKRALSKSNLDSSAYISYANVMFQMGSFQDAAFYYGLALRFDPLNVEAMVGAAKALSELQGLEQGINYLQSAIERSPYQAALLNGVGEVYARKGDYESALKFAAESLKIDSHYGKAYRTRGQAYLGQGKTKEALKAFKTYSQFAPADPIGHIERYKIFMANLDLKSARQEIEAVIQSYPRYPGAYYMLGELFQLGQNYEAALKAAEQEIKNNPGYVPAYVLAGTVYNTQREYQKALDVLTKGLTIDETYVPGLIQAGFANHQLKTYAAAQSMFERALAQDQGNPQIHKRLGALLLDMGDRSGAREHIKMYLNLMPDAPDRAQLERFVNSGH